MGPVRSGFSPEHKQLALEQEEESGAGAAAAAAAAEEKDWTLALPNQSLSIIFGYLPGKEWGSAASVCKRWKGIIEKLIPPIANPTATLVEKLIKGRGPFVALPVAERMLIPGEQSKAFQSICLKFFDKTEFNAALELVKRISDGPIKTDTIYSMVFWSLHRVTPNPGQALAFIQVMRQQKLKSNFLVDICREFVKKGNLIKALEVANTVHHEWEKSVALGLVAEGHFNKGEIARATEVANSIPNAGKKATILRAIDSNGQTSWF